MRFWLRFVNRRVDLIERGCGALLVDEFRAGWPSFRGRAVEQLVRDSLERLLPDGERFGAARYVGGYWNRTGTIEVDLVGGDARPLAKRVAFVGSVKWRTRGRFGRADAQQLAARRAQCRGRARRRCSSESARADSSRTSRSTPPGQGDLVDAWRE